MQHAFAASTTIFCLEVMIASKAQSVRFGCTCCNCCWAAWHLVSAAFMVSNDLSVCWPMPEYLPGVPCPSSERSSVTTMTLCTYWVCTDRASALDAGKFRKPAMCYPAGKYKQSAHSTTGTKAPDPLQLPFATSFLTNRCYKVSCVHQSGYDCTNAYTLALVGDVGDNTH